MFEKSLRYVEVMWEPLQLCGAGRDPPFCITTFGGVCILLAIGRRNCSATLTCNPLLDEERAVYELYTLRLTLNQKSNAESIQKVDILQVELWRICASFNFYLQLRQILLLHPAAQLKNDWCFTQKLLDA